MYFRNCTLPGHVGLSALCAACDLRDRLERGQAPLPDLFYSQLRKRRMELESENKTSQEEGLAPRWVKRNAKV